MLVISGSVREFTDTLFVIGCMVKHVVSPETHTTEETSS